MRVLSKYSQSFRLFGLTAFILSLLVFNAWFLHQNFTKVSQQEQLVSSTATVMNELDLTLSATKDAETGVRGYLLARQNEYLEPFRQGTLEAWEHISRVKALTRDNPSQQQAIATLERIIKERFDILTDLLAAFRKGGFKIDSGAVQFSEGKAVMDNLRTQIEKIKTTENELLSSHARDAEQSKSLFFWSLIGTTLLSIAVILGAFSQIGFTQEKMRADAIEKQNQAREKDIIAEVARLVSGDITVQVAGKRVLEFMSKDLGILAGRLFLVENGPLRLITSYGVSEISGAEFSGTHQTESGLVKTALSRDAIWEIKDIPPDYWRISSSLGNAIPRTLSLLPFSFQNKPLGVFELASFNELSAKQKKLLENLREVISVGLQTAQSRGNLQALLERTQQQSEELQAQQEELKSTNEELEQQARALESQQQTMNIKNSELQTAQLEVQQKAEELQRSNQYKSDFLAKMSHELRTPLNGLLILSTLLLENKEGTLTDRQLEFARSIQNAGNDLLVLINDILDLSKIEARKLALRPEDFTLESLFRSKRRTFGPQVTAKGLEFITDLPEDLAGLLIHTDRHRLEQILRNFISNAIKFTENGSITLRAHVDRDPQFISLIVADTGIGISKDKQEIVFNAFEQADSSVSRKYGGTGLGLTISKELATLLNGDISLESEVGVGSQFCIRIPRYLSISQEGDTASESALKTTLSRPTSQVKAPPKAALEQKDERTKHLALAALKGLDRTKKTILVVEDDEAFRSSIVETVRSYHFEAIETGDGEVALAILEEVIPDAVLLDIKLPGISGLSILEVIKQIPKMRHVPVHMVSALDYQHNALRMGALGYLTKPVTIEKIRSALDRISSIIAKDLRRVLLIEDDERQSVAISELISDDNIEVISASTGKAAIQSLQQHMFDCIILDLTLPDMSGFDVLSQLSSLDISVPPVVIYTGKDLSDEEEQHLRKYSESIVIKGARSPGRLLDEVNLFLHRVESLLPDEKRQMLSLLRSQEKSFEGKTILVVDDDIRNVFALTSALESKGISVRVARNGVEALEQLEQHPETHLVLMDIMMPKMDGFEAIKRIRQHANTRIRTVPVVALTAKAMREDHEKCMDAGASDYLPKPVNLDNLTTVLKVWLAPKGFLT